MFSRLPAGRRARRNQDTKAGDRTQPEGGADLLEKVLVIPVLGCGGGAALRTQYVKTRGWEHGSPVRSRERKAAKGTERRGHPGGRADVT